MLAFVSGGSPCKINAKCPKLPIPCIAREIVPSFWGQGLAGKRAGYKTVSEQITTMKKKNLLILHSEYYYYP